MDSWRENRLVFWVLALPGTFWLTVFFLIPLGLIWLMSFGEKTSLIDIEITGTLDNYVRTTEWVYLQILWKSVWISVLATALCLVVAYPVAFAICFSPERWKPLLLLAVILPFWINLLIRTYALIAVFRTQGYLNYTLEWLWWFGHSAFSLVGLGFVFGERFEPLSLLYNNAAVIAGLVYVYMPFMVLPLYATIERLDRSYIEASLDLGASQSRTFLSVTVPLTMPGIVSGVILVFIPCLGAFLTPDLLGGANAVMIGNVIERQFKAANDWPFGAALSFLLMYATFGILALRSAVATPLRRRNAVLRRLTSPDQGPLDYGRRLWLKLALGLIFVLLYAPIAILVAFSFNDSRRNIVWQGFTTKYYAIAWRNDSLVEAFVNSLAIAVMCTIIATVIGAMTALLLWRFRFPGKPGYEGFMALPIVIPEICMGVSLLVFFARAGRWMATFESGPIAWWTDLFSVWPLTLSAITVAHVAFAFPFVAVVVRARMVGFNRELEEASRDLGASEWQTFWNVIFPFMRPGLIAGALLAFTLSLDDFVITFFTSGPDTVTFPVKVYSLVRRGVSPDINAASTVLIVITLVATVLAMHILRPDKREAV